MDTFIGILNYLVFFAITAGIYAVLCLGLNIQWGYTGLFNIGIAGFFAVGAYTSALLSGPPPGPLDWRIVGGFQLPCHHRDCRGHSANFEKRGLVKQYRLGY